MPRPRRDGSPTKAADKRKLTDLTVKRLAPQPRPFLVWDTLQRGLALSVQPTGHKSYKVIYPFRGKPRWVSLAAADAISLPDARKLASRIMFQVAEGKDPAAERKAQRSQGTFAELAARYVTEHARKHNKSWKHAARLVDKYLTPRWGKLPAATITRSDVKVAMAAIEAPQLANAVLAHASAIFSWAMREELVEGNPCRQVTRNPISSRERVLSDSELPKFWAAFEQAGLPGVALKLILLTGQRPGEVAAMRHQDLTDGWWVLPGAPDGTWPGTKNGASHRVWLSQPVQAMLADVAGGDTTGVVFSRIGKLAAVMQRICADLGLSDKVTPHDLRRTFSTTVASLGFGREAMNRVTNHKEGGIASVYDRHQYADENKRIMEAVAARILALATGEAATNVVVLPMAAQR
jgi:integrase